MHEVISIKGSRDGLRILIEEAHDWNDVLQALHVQLDQSGNFFAGARMIVEIGSRQLTREQLSEMLSLMDRYGLQPETLSTSIRESREAARALGLAIRALPQPNQTSDGVHTDGDAAFLFKTIRSGQVVRHQGHMTLVGDVNPGAQVIAGGSVIVWGRLRGMVHAGALGNANALVGALELRPTQLRIAGLIARTPEDDTRSHPPEIARIEHECIVVEPWETFKKI